MNQRKAPDRIAVIGSSGAGKSALASELSVLLGVPHVELDALYWTNNWVKITEGSFRAVVNEMSSADKWIIDGNYSVVRDMVWTRADAIVWLDYSFALTIRRLISRTLMRITLRQPTWHGNRETWQRLFSRDSIVWWALSTFARRREDYARRWRSKELQDTVLKRFTNPRQANDWLQELKNSI